MLTPVDLAGAAAGDRAAGKPLFVQISDTHIGFNKEANPDVGATLAARRSTRSTHCRSSPRSCMHTGDITHLSQARPSSTPRRSC